VNNEQENIAFSGAATACVGVNAIAGRAAHHDVHLDLSENQCRRGFAAMLQNGICGLKTTLNLSGIAKNACPKGQIAHLDTSFSSVRERRHGIIPSHRIRFALTCGGITVRECFQVPSPQGAKSKRSSRVSRKTGDQNASSF
jgi:hypothetical protein